jgi:hypothetical protein
LSDKAPADFVSPATRRFLDRFIEIAARGRIRDPPASKAPEPDDADDPVVVRGTFLYRTRRPRP